MNNNMLGLVLSIAGAFILCAIVASGFLSAKSTGSDQTLVDQYQRLVFALTERYQNEPSYGTGDLVPSILTKAPDKMVVGTQLFHSQDGQVTADGQGRTALITFSGTSANGCVALATQAWDAANSRQGMATAISINGSAQTLPITPATAAIACANTGSGATGGNAVAFTVSKSL